MSTSDSTVKGKLDQVTGKAKQVFGEAVGNQATADKGAAQQVKGHAEESWGAVKEAAHDTSERQKPRAEADAHDVREKITSTAANVKEHITHAADRHKNT